MKPGDANAVEQCLGPLERVAVHPAWRRTVAPMLAARLNLSLPVTERIPTPFKTVLNMR